MGPYLERSVTTWKAKPDETGSTFLLTLQDSLNLVKECIRLHFLSIEKMDSNPGQGDQDWTDCMNTVGSCQGAL